MWMLLPKGIELSAQSYRGIWKGKKGYVGIFRSIWGVYGE